jgi:hypothetical protein
MRAASFLAFAAVAAAVLLVAAAAGGPPQFHIESCRDKVNCAGCKYQGHADDHADADRCVPLPHSRNGERAAEWMCNDTVTLPCFSLVAYPLGSGCHRGAVFREVNYCDECKRGHTGDDDGPLLHRRCHNFTGGGRPAVSYFECAAWNVSRLGNAKCSGCNATAEATYPLGECVRVGGLEWRLETTNNTCRAMVHAHYTTPTCAPASRYWEDRTVLDACNRGFRFSCPPF